MTPRRKITVTCTGCGETWESDPRIVGTLCGDGQVQLLTEPRCFCESGSWDYVECEVH
jgi:hypothetical protein